MATTWLDHSPVGIFYRGTATGSWLLVSNDRRTSHQVGMVVLDGSMVSDPLVISDVAETSSSPRGNSSVDLLFLIAWEQPMIMTVDDYGSQ